VFGAFLLVPSKFMTRWSFPVLIPGDATAAVTVLQGWIGRCLFFLKPCAL
jgi:hypothetical protein